MQNTTTWIRFFNVASLILLALVMQGRLHAQSAYLDDEILTIVALESGNEFIRIELEQVNDQPAEFQLLGLANATDVEQDEVSVFDGSTITTPLIILNGVSFTADFVLASLTPPILRLNALRPVGQGAGFADIATLLELAGEPGPQGPPGPPGPPGAPGAAGTTRAIRSSFPGNPGSADGIGDHSRCPPGAA